MLNKAVLKKTFKSPTQQYFHCLSAGIKLSKLLHIASALEIKDVLLSHYYIEISSVTIQYKSKIENCYWHRLQNVINVT